MNSHQAPHEGSSYELPPLTNPPPQMFGPYAPGSPTTAIYPHDYFGDEQNGAIDESNEAKRRRIARACDMCRKKKIKCDGKMPSCSHCLNYKTECIFTQVEKKRNPPKGAKYIEGLENRLGRMESLLKLSGLLNEDDGDRTDLGTLERRLADKTGHMSNGDRSSKSPSGSDGFSQPQESIETPHLASPDHDRDRKQDRRQSRQSPRPSPLSPETAKEPEGEVEALSDMMCSLVTNNCGETRYIGSSSGFSIFSPKGIQWVNEKTGDNSFQEVILSVGNDEKHLMHWKPEVFGDIFTRKVYMALPPRHEALSLLKDYFENFNCIFPLFHEPTFMHLVNRHYSRDPYNGSGWWASLNVALAIAHRLRVVSNLVPMEEDDKAWGFMKNSLAIFAELTMRNTDLLSVQALLGMALFLQGTPNPQPSFVLVAAAIRLAHSIGLHKRGSGFNLNPVEVEQRKRVFWIAYLLDKDICLRSGRPPAQDDDDMNVDLPSQDPGDNVGNIPLADGKGKLNLFRLMCTFSVIESKVYNQLYSTKASKQSDGALLNTIGELDHELEEWKEAIPIDFRPEHEIKATHTPLILHVVVLHFAYYNCLTTIHRMSVHHGYWTSRLSNYAIQGLNARPLNPRVFSSATLCVQAARASIHLLKYIPQGDHACVWMIIYYPVSALVTLFANVLQNPQDARARSDIRLMNQVVHFLSLLTHGEEQAGVRRMHATCEEFERIARIVLEKAENESHSRRKRKANGAAKDDKDENREAKDAKDEGADKSKATSPHLAATKEPNGAYLSNSPETAPGLTPDSGLMPPAFAGDTSTPRSNFAMLSGASPNSPATSINSNPNNNINGLAIQMPDYMPAPGDFPNMMTPLNGYPTFPTTQVDFQQQFGQGMDPSMEGGFPQQFVPQDVWQLPMTLDWDWADMAGGGGGPTMHEWSVNGMNMEGQRQG